MRHLVTFGSDVSKIKTELDKLPQATLYKLADNIYSNSDDADDRSGWDDIKHHYTDESNRKGLIETIIEFAKDHYWTYNTFKRELKKVSQ